ncbi:hypothetical protein LTS10_002677 [Elasticomyces elasticus]|nr:hypothetical protein LTS10_002677 [Elasticomyces elasticus]
MKCLFLAAVLAVVLVKAFPTTPADPAAPDVAIPTDCLALDRVEVRKSYLLRSGMELADIRQFEEFEPATFLPQIFSPIGEFRGVKYGGFYAQTANGKTQGLNAAEDKKDKNVAAANLLSDVVHFGQLAIQPFGTLSLSSS